MESEERKNKRSAALIVGASAGLGRALCRALAARDYDLLLVARDSTDLEAEANHLRTVFGVRVATVAADAQATDSFVEAVKSAASSFDDLAAILFPIGKSCAGDFGAMPMAQARVLIDVNFTSVAALIDALLSSSSVARCVVIGFGSIAAVRGRGNNVVYSAAKRALESYFESLRHRFSDSDIRVQFYRLGYLDTGQSYGKQLLLPSASPEAIARRVVRGLDEGHGFVTLPRFWWLVTSAIRLMPWWLYKRLRF